MHLVVDQLPEGEQPGYAMLQITHLLDMQVSCGAQCVSEWCLATTDTAGETKQRPTERGGKFLKNHTYVTFLHETWPVAGWWQATKLANARRLVDLTGKLIDASSGRHRLIIGTF